MGVLINRDEINAKFLTQFVTDLEIEQKSLADDFLPHFSLTPTLLNSLTRDLSWIKTLQLNLQFINVPVLLFSTYISSFFIYMNFKSRLDEVLLLKVRGVPFKVIRNQFVIENVINGVIASLFGTILGWFSKSLYYATVTPYLFQNSSEVYFSQNFSFLVFPRTCLIGVIIAIWASIRALKSFKSMEMAELLNELDRKNLEVEYDENSLFGMNEDEKREIYSDRIEYSLEEDERDLYNNIVDLFEKQKPKKSIMKFILASLPVGYFLFQFWAPNPNNPDWVYYLSDFIISIQEGIPFLMLAISLITPVLLTIGLIHLLVTDHPSRFARLTKSIATLFLHDKAHLAGLQIIKEKKLAKMIFVFALHSFQR
ncbi:MAG: FtsX-like permease family protein [Promethearchaeota archaeon]